MRRLCSVPGCRSGRYNDEARKRRMGMRSTSIFAVPKCDTRLRRWSEALGFAVQKTDFVCELHFADTDIKKSDDFFINGKKKSIPRVQWALSDVAVPLRSCPSTSDKHSCNRADSGVRDEEVAQNNRSVVFATPSSEASSNMEMPDAAALCEAPSKCEMQDEVNEQHNLSDGEVNQPVQATTFSMEMLKDHLKTTYLPRLWAWNVETSSVVFINFNRADYSVRAQVIISSDLSVKIRTSSGRVLEAEIRLESYQDVLMWFRIIENLSFCTGTGFDTEKRDVRCIGLLEKHDEYVRTPKNARCLHCRSLRKRLQSKPQKNFAPKLTAVKSAAKLTRRKYVRLRRKNEKLLANVSELRKQCAETKAKCVDEAISTLPENQREAVLACFAASKIASNGGHRYT